jgi:hypothetical protein
MGIGGKKNAVLKKVEENLANYAIQQAFHHSGKGSISHVIFVLNKVALRQGFSEHSVSPANSHSTNCYIFINHHIDTI